MFIPKKSDLRLFVRAREAQYNIDEGVVKLYLRGRPLNLYVPTPLQETYNPTGPTSPPPAKLKLEWVYGYRWVTDKQ